ncbi:hypothetical protein TNCV_5112701 [Trichonephila clavipes]|nr:hypothetical protein TNCV_5112701 [Trichonephila clavipes]
MVHPRFIPRHNPKQKSIAILMVTDVMFEADHYALFHLCRDKLSGPLSCGHLSVSKNVVDDLLKKVDAMIKTNRRITIDEVAEGLGIGHERSQKMQSPEFFLEGFLKLIQLHGKCLNVLVTYVEK